MRGRRLLALCPVVLILAGLVAFQGKASDLPVTATALKPASYLAADQPDAFPFIADVPLKIAAAHAVVPAVNWYRNPGDAAPAGALGNPNLYGLPLVFGIVDRQGEWLQVQLPQRPNGSIGWIRSADVFVQRLENRIVVEVAARRLTLYHGDDILMQETVAVGAPTGPTPTGSFYIDASVETGRPTGAYGVRIMSVAAYSDVYFTFGGGIGQIAIHGTNRPELLGQPVSHGCIRMTNDAITRLNDLAPVGTPVEIIP
jgi:lipoprotein-anchoring transpeptidase ErfK/SrfK